MIGSLIFNAITQIVLNLAESSGGEFVKRQIQGFFAQPILRAKVAEAAQRGYDRFIAANDDPELSQALTNVGTGSSGGFGADPAVAELLARYATNQITLHVAEHTLIAMLAHAAPYLAQQRYHHAARRLLAMIHTEVGLLPELHQTVMILRGEQMLDELRHLRPTPEYAPGVREAIIAAASAAATEMGHGYVTTAHLFYALLVQERGLVRTFLAKRGVAPERVAAILIDAIEPYGGQVADPITAPTVLILERAREIARDAAAPSTRDDHVFLAILEQAGKSDSLTYLLLQLQLNAAIMAAAIKPEGQVMSVMQVTRPRAS